MWGNYEKTISNICKISSPLGSSSRAEACSQDGSIAIFNQKKWREEHKEYFKKWNENHRERLNECARKRYADNPEHYREYRRQWRKNHPEYAKKHLLQNKIIRQQRKLKIFNIISGNNPVCVRCGCDDIRLLEINHKNGGGRKESGQGKQSTFCGDILHGRREVDDLELLCRVCNSWHYLEMKYGELPYTIIYDMKIKI